MHGKGGGGSGTVFFPKLAVTVDGLRVFACSGRVLDILALPPTPITGCAFGGG